MHNPSGLLLYALISINVMAISIAIVILCTYFECPAVNHLFFDKENARLFNTPIIVAPNIQLKVITKTSGKEALQHFSSLYKK